MVKQYIGKINCFYIIKKVWGYKVKGRYPSLSHHPQVHGCHPRRYHHLHQHHQKPRWYQRAQGFHWSLVFFNSCRQTSGILAFKKAWAFFKAWRSCLVHTQPLACPSPHTSLNPRLLNPSFHVFVHMLELQVFSFILCDANFILILPSLVPCIIALLQEHGSSNSTSASFLSWSSTTSTRPAILWDSSIPCSDSPWAMLNICTSLKIGLPW